MNKFLSFATRFIGAAIIPAIATYAWTVQNHDSYWNRTIFAVQTIDFKILAHTLPTKLSILLIQKDIEELQRTLQSNTGRFGMVVTDCKTVYKSCPDQKILYKTDSKSSWSKQLSLDSLVEAPFDLLRDPPPTKAEIDFLDAFSEKFTETGVINQGKIIGRVYYVRGIPPSYLESWSRYIENRSSGAGNFYSAALITFFFSSLFLFVSLEIFLIKLRDEKQKRKQLSTDLRIAKSTSQNLKKRLEIEKAQTQILSEQNQRQSIDLIDKEQLLIKLEEEFEDSQIQAELKERSLQISLGKVKEKLKSQQILVESQQREMSELLREKESIQVELNSQVAHLDKLRQDLIEKQRASIDQSAEFNKLIHQLSLKNGQKENNKLLINSLTLRLSKLQSNELTVEKSAISEKINVLNQTQTSLDSEIKILQAKIEIIQKSLTTQSLEIQKLTSDLEKNRLQQELTNENLATKQSQLNGLTIALQREKENFESSQRKSVELNIELQDSHKKIDKLVQERLDLKADIDSIRLDKQEIEQNLQAIQLEISAKEQKIQELQFEIEGRDFNFRALQNHNAKLQQEINESQESERYDNDFELTVYQYIQNLSQIKSKSWITLANFDVGNYQRSLQTDFIIITQGFVAVLEVKFATGQITTKGDPKNTEWFSNNKLIRAGSQYRKNPYVQVSTYAKSLMGRFNKNLPKNKSNIELPFYGIIVFPDEVNLENFSPQIGGYYYVTTLSKLAKLLCELESLNRKDIPNITVGEIEGVISGTKVLWLKDIA